MEPLSQDTRRAIITECQKQEASGLDEDGIVTCDLGAITYKVKYGFSEPLTTRITTQPFLREKAGQEPAQKIHIPRIIDQFEHEGITYLVMEFIQHFMYIVAIKDTKAWQGYTAFELSMVGFWNLIFVWLKV